MTADLPRHRRATPRQPGLRGGHAVAIAGLGLLILSGGPAQGQTATPAAAHTAAASSRITQVLVYPGGATVQRSAPVAAGATQLVLGCLPGGLDADSLQLNADAGITLGDLSLQTLPRQAAPGCAVDATLAGRIRALEDRKASLQAEHEAHALVLATLKAPAPLAPAATALPAHAEAVRRLAQEALQRQHQLDRSQQTLDDELTPLLAERERQAGGDAPVRTLTVRLAAARAGELRLQYRVPQAGWTPLYRARLDSTGAQGPQLRLERLAQVAQASGEDWRGVPLRLSTTQPRQSTQPATPRPWTLVPRPAATPMARAAVAAPAPAMAMEMAQAKLGDAAGPVLPNFDVSVFEGAFATEYALPGLVQLQSDGQQVTFLLDAGQAQPVQLYTRVQPQQSTQAFLVAELKRPAGDWPTGALQLYRDNEFIGQTRLQLGSLAELHLGFGRDDRLRTEAAPPDLGGAQAGFLGNRSERRVQHRYTLDNRGRQPLLVQVIEPTPVPQHDDIRVEAKFVPEPRAELWQQQPGIRLWQLPLAPGQQATLQADYLISQPRDMAVIERR